MQLSLSGAFKSPNNCVFIQLLGRRWNANQEVQIKGLVVKGLYKSESGNVHLHVYYWHIWLDPRLQRFDGWTTATSSVIEMILWVNNHNPQRQQLLYITYDWNFKPCLKKCIMDMKKKCKCVSSMNLLNSSCQWPFNMNTKLYLIVNTLNVHYHYILNRHTQMLHAQHTYTSTHH